MAARVKSKDEKVLRKELTKQKDIVNKNLRPPEGQVGRFSARITRDSLDKFKEAHGRLIQLITEELVDAEADPEKEPNVAAWTKEWDTEEYNDLIWIDESEDLYTKKEKEVMFDAQKVENAAQAVKLINEFEALVKILNNRTSSYVNNLAEEIDHAAYKDIQNVHSGIVTEVKVDLKKLTEEIGRLDPLKKTSQNDRYHAVMVEVIKSADDLASQASKRLIRAQSTPNQSFSQDLTSNENSSQSSSTRSTDHSNYLYQKRNYPKFTGEIRTFPKWYAEWYDTVQHKYSDAVVISLLHENTPASINLLNCETKEEAFKELKDRYANPNVVCTTLINEFLAFKPSAKLSNVRQLMEVEQKLTGLYKDLVTVKEEEQLTRSQFMINHAVKSLPQEYQDEIVKLLLTNDKKAAGQKSSLWEIVHTYLKDTRKGIERHASWLGSELLGDGAASAVASNSSGPRFCKKCNVKHTGPCEVKKINNVKSSPVSTEMREKWKEWGKCPVCGKLGHSYTNKSGNKYASSRLYDCQKWSSMPIAQKIKSLEDAKGCSICCSWLHNRDNCDAQYQKCGYKDGVNDPCSERHNRAFHGVTHNYINAIAIPRTPSQETPGTVLLHMQEIQIGKTPTTLFLDDGSSTSIITHYLAKKLGLKGYKTTEWLCLATEAPKLREVTIYTMRLSNNDGLQVKLRLMGAKTISSKPVPIDVSFAYQYFPQVPHGSLERPNLDIGLLIGNDAAEFLPTGGEEAEGWRVGGLRCMRSSFGSGYVLGGRCEAGGDHLVFSDEAELFRVASIAKQPVQPPIININYVQRFPNLPDAYEADDLGIRLPPLCESCTGCSKCTTQRQELTRDEIEVYNLTRKAMEVVEEEGIVKATYPMNDNLDKLQDNRGQAIKRATSVEKSLEKKKMTAHYNEVFQDTIDRGALTEVTVQEINDWKDKGGKVHYIGHHPVYKMSSKTTPVRMVSDSALKNNYIGPSLNNCMPKPPNSINNLLKVLLRWRGYETAIVFDLKKAYNTIRTGDLEKFLRLKVWRFGDSEAEWRTFGYLVVAFGDQLASLILEIAKQMVAELGESKGFDHDAVQKLLEDFYVDDAVTGCPLEDVPRLLGTPVEDDAGNLTYDGQFSQILKLGGFKIKAAVCSGDNPQAALDKMGAILGHDWRPKEDELVFKWDLKLQVKNKLIDASLTMDNLDDLDVTKRSCLGVTSQHYDPMGLNAPLLVKYKIAMKDVVALKTTWDEKLPPRFERAWKKFIAEMINLPEIRFSRSVRPADATSNAPEFIGFWDGADHAYAACIYARYPVSEDTWTCTLLTAKSRVTPSKGLTTPRAELNGLVILCRLMSVAIDAAPVKPTRVTLIGDSTCTISSLECTSNVLAPYFCNRVAECLDHIKSWGRQDDDISVNVEHVSPSLLVDQVQHVAGDLNIADLGTRGQATVEDISLGSTWQKGPKFLSANRDTWPVSRSFVRDVPKEEKRMKVFRILSHVEIVKNEQWLSTIMHKHDRYDLVLGIFARLIHANLAGAEALTRDPLADHYKKSHQLMLWLSMADTCKLEEEGKLANLAVFWEDGICWTRGRPGIDGLEAMLGVSKLPVLSSNSPMARMLMIKSHKEDHKKHFTDALYRSRKYAWIVGAAPLAKKIVAGCALCKLTNTRLAEQRMGQLPIQQFQVPCRPFTNVQMDFCGPYQVSAMTNSRAKLKTYPLVIVCINTAAVQIMLCSGYSTRHFLTQFENFISMRGCPKFVHTDSGSQLTRAKASIGAKNDMMHVDWTQVASKTAHVGIEWKVAPPQGQWRDGRAEAAVKALKRSLHHMHSGGDLTYEEFQVMLNRAAYVINNRPLGLRASNGLTPGLQPITPNLLLMNGRTDGPIYEDERYGDEADTYILRLRFLEVQFQAWWREWMTKVFDGLVPYPKWSRKSRNLMKGDICLLHYQSRIGS